MSRTKSDTTKDSTAPEATSKVTPSMATFQKELQKQFDQETEQGFRGVEVDQTPNEAYTVAGVTAKEKK